MSMEDYDGEQFYPALSWYLSTRTDPCCSRNSSGLIIIVEFGNYIGGDLDSDDDDESINQDLGNAGAQSTTAGQAQQQQPLEGYEEGRDGDIDMDGDERQDQVAIPGVGTGKLHFQVNTI